MTQTYMEKRRDRQRIGSPCLPSWRWTALARAPRHASGRQPSHGSADTQSKARGVSASIKQLQASNSCKQLQASNSCKQLQASNSWYSKQRSDEITWNPSMKLIKELFHLIFKTKNLFPYRTPSRLLKQPREVRKKEGGGLFVSIVQFIT